ncbi:hypothetical protein V6N13_124479 [Hibiscus sabdariffa]|uniref:Uncharacterized protein n=2 Tax=Hibiscus sabdariffa TaxID=183260 RepID=A0ABR1ZUI6_9ROSI
MLPQDPNHARNELTCVHPSVNPGGRPLDLVPVITSSQILERSASSTPIHGQPASKKNRTHDLDSEVSEVVVAMEAACDVPVQKVVSTDPYGGLDTGDGRGEGSQRTEKQSYASMAAKSANVGEHGKSAAAIIDEEIVILEDDVIVERDEAIPSVQFSDRVYHQEVCGRNLATATRGGVDSPAIAPPKKMDISKANLFGPWMVVENRRRKVGAPDRSSTLP